jgi:hypothetical protein
MSEATPAQLEVLFERIRADGVEVRVCDMAALDADMAGRGAMVNDLLHGTVRGGCYFNRARYPAADLSGYPEFLLAINQSMDRDCQFSTAIHEWGHHRCHVSGCACSNPDVFHPIAETHVHRFVLRELSAYDLPRVTCRYMAEIVQVLPALWDAGHWDTEVMAHLYVYLAKRNRHWREARTKYAAEWERAMGGGSGATFENIPDEHVRHLILSNFGISRNPRYYLLAGDFLHRPTLQ